MQTVHVVTLFPELVEQVVAHGMPRIAVARGAMLLETHNPRRHAGNTQGRPDDRPFGGGPGMVLQAEPLARTLEQDIGPAATGPVIYLSPQGEAFTQAWAARLAELPAYTLVCGRYEGLDERFLEAFGVAELSVGDVVLSGGELPAMMVVDAVARLLPGVLGHAASAVEDSFASGRAGLLDHPHYTRPEVWRGQKVPEVLLGGNHGRIVGWRAERALVQTWLKRPDLVSKSALTPAQEIALRRVIAETLDALDIPDTLSPLPAPVLPGPAAPDDSSP